MNESRCSRYRSMFRLRRACAGSLGGSGGGAGGSVASWSGCRPSSCVQASSVQRILLCRLLGFVGFVVFEGFIGWGGELGSNVLQIAPVSSASSGTRHGLMRSWMLVVPQAAQGALAVLA